MDSLFSLSYVSSAVHELSEEESARLLASARRRNQQRGISGMLLYKSGDFMQVLEGPRTAVEEVFLSISRDARHRGIMVLWRKVIAERAFADWSMGFHNFASSANSELEGYKPLTGLSFLDEQFRARPDAAYRLLLSFCDTLKVTSAADVLLCDPSERSTSLKGLAKQSS